MRGVGSRGCAYVINVDVPNLFGNPLDAPPPVMFVVRVCDAYTYPHIYINTVFVGRLLLLMRSVGETNASLKS